MYELPPTRGHQLPTQVEGECVFTVPRSMTHGLWSRQITLHHYYFITAVSRFLFLLIAIFPIAGSISLSVNHPLVMSNVLNGYGAFVNRGKRISVPTSAHRIRGSYFLLPCQ
ncbi:hypothetical protein AVEN_83168-1 [Araneus ventricosus]|uniref:Uncharacterized protein n=1 Tax=Araneus ventricosus TaxID=182803 RepID=A0A4Y2AMQ8_ARAVE|nr:hypothetical protein AVEN_83168-1 [Araneus ventricosus]